MVKATFKGKTIAESDEYEEVEGNIYFPPDSVNKAFLEENDHHTTCPWKGEANYYDVTVEGDTIENGAWYYPEPSEDASHIKDHVAFWKGVKVES